MISATTLFTVTPAKAAGQQWKAVAPSASDATQVFQAKKNTATNATAGGTTKLADKLTGVAGDLFKFLSEKTQKKLDNLVSNGTLKLEEVSLGLRSIASKAVFSRYSAERPKTEAEIDSAKKIEMVQNQMFRPSGKDDDGTEALRRNLMTAFDNNEISPEELQEKMRPVHDAMTQKQQALKKLQQDVLGTDLISYSSKQMNAYLKSSIEQFNAGVVPRTNLESNDGFLEYADPKGLEAEEKLLTFFSPETDKSAFTRDQIGAYAASVDLPGIGKGTYIPITDIAPPSGRYQATGTATAGRATPAAVATGSGGTTVSLLQSALDAKTGQNSATGVTGAQKTTADDQTATDAALTSLIDAIKNGTPPTSPSVIIDA